MTKQFTSTIWEVVKQFRKHEAHHWSELSIGVTRLIGPTLIILRGLHSFP